MERGYNASFMISLIGFTFILIFAGVGFFALSLMKEQGIRAITSFNERELPRLKQVCKDRGMVYTGVAGRGQGGTWNIICTSTNENQNILVQPR